MGAKTLSLNMHSKAPISLRSFFRSILRFFGMSSSPPPENEFPGETIVENWEAYLLERYHSRDSEKSPKYRLRKDTLKVNAIRRFKETRYVEHEYLIAEIHDPDLGQKRYLRIERTVERSQDTTERTGSSQSISTLSTQSSLGVLKKLPARDRVSTTSGWPSLAGPGKNGDICIEELDCEPSTMTLLDLAIVAKVVHDHSDMYDVFKRQCFWYSDVITGILQQSFPDVKVTTDSSLENERGPEAKMEIYDNKCGTFKSVQIYHRRRSAIEKIRDTYDVYNTQVKSSVNLFEHWYISSN
jgi:hypothetical protein